MPRVSEPAHRRSYVSRLLFSLVVLSAALLVVFFRQEILDKYNYMTYVPSAEVMSVTDRAGLSEQGTYLFYASRPALQSRASFNESCRSVASEQTAILGCYAAQRIYLFDIDDPKLDGVKEVTAAHEMLHAAYERMSREEKESLNRMLDAQSKSLGADQARVDELMAEYAVSEPGEHFNELHSILGSEIAVLSPELEAYYRQFFSDRAELVARAQAYQAVFSELEQRQDALVSELGGLADTVDQLSAAYRRNLQVLETDIASFNRRASGGTLSRDAYDRERSALLLRQRALRQDYQAIQDLIAAYEAKRTELAAINSESNALNRSLNSSLSAETSESL